MSIYGNAADDHTEWIVPDLTSGTVWLVGSLLFVAGVIMTAGGAGGGSVFVPILIGVGSLGTHEAIPLSKFVIFAGSVCSFILLTRRTCIIDFTLVRAIVPLSLAGTLIGVALNVLLSAEVLLILLSCLLAVLFVKSAMLAVARYRSEAVVSTEVVTKPEISEGASFLPGKNLLFWSTTTGRNWLMTILVPLSVVGGFTSKLSSVSLAGEILLLLVPILACIAVAWFFHKLEPQVGLAYPILGFVGGVSSGLFGLGGGLLYSPFLLHAKVEPAVAVAVSTTCVFFASTSSTLQYLFMGRISILFGLFFSCFAIVSSIVAQKLVWLITEKLRKPFYIFCLVTAIIGSSLAFTIAKSVMVSQGQSG